jgi:hypothetical protein
MAGGYPAYYYTHTAWDVIKPEHTPPGYAYWKILADFFGALKFWEFEPAPGYCRIRAAKCLARNAPGGQGSAAAANGTRTGFARDEAEELVFFSDQEDRNTLWMTNTLDFSRYTGYWMDILGGEKQTFAAASIKISSDGLDRMTVANPFSPHPAVLYLKRT